MKLGFLGVGAMGGAILSGAVKSGVIKAEDIYVYDVIPELNEKYEQMGCKVAKGPKDLAKSVDMLLSCDKPHYPKAALAELGKEMNGNAKISNMAGLTT